MPLFGPPNIEKLKEKRDVKGLVRALRNRDWRVRRHAAQVLGGLADLLGFPKTDWGDEPDDWPRRWPWRTYLGVDMGPVRPRVERFLEAEEEPLGVLSVVLSVVKSGITYTVAGQRAVQIVRSIGYAQSLPDVPAHALLLCITNIRVIVADNQKSVWASKVEDLHTIHFHKEGDFQHLELDFGDGDPLWFSASKVVSMQPWVEECNRYLDLVRRNDESALERYVKYVTSADRGGERAAQALIAALSDKEEQVRSAAAEALDYIGGPEAQRALAEYRARQK